MNIPRSRKEIKKLFLENKSLKQVFFKNITWLSISEFVTRFFTVTLTIFIARILGAENYGLLTFAISFAGLFSVLSGFCDNSIIVREFNQRKEAKDELGTVLWLKILLGVVVFVFIIGTSFFIENTAARLIIMIFAAIVLFNSVSSFFKAIFQALQKIQYIAITEMGRVLFLATAGFLVLFTHPNITFIAYSYLSSACFASLIAFFVARHLSVLPPLVLDVKIAKKYLSLSWPLALSTVFGVIYVQIDSVMMGFWNMIKEVGWYQAAYKITTFVVVPGSIISTVFYPALSQTYKVAKERFQRIINVFFEALVFFTLAIVVGGFLLAPAIISFLYTEEFLPSVLAFKILIFTSGIIFFTMYMDSLLVVANRQKLIFYITGSTALLNIILNLILIPKYSLYGAAVATLISYIFLFIFGVIVLRKIKMSPNLKTILAPFLAVSAMAIFLYSGIAQNIHLIFQILIAGLIYSFLFFMIKAILKGKIISKYVK